MQVNDYEESQEGVATNTPELTTGTITVRLSAFYPFRFHGSYLRPKIPHASRSDVLYKESLSFRDTDPNEDI